MAATVYSLSALTLAKSEGLAVCQMIDFVNTIAFGEFLFSKWRLNKNYGEKETGAGEMEASGDSGDRCHNCVMEEDCSCIGKRIDSDGRSVEEKNVEQIRKRWRKMLKFQ